MNILALIYVRIQNVNIRCENAIEKFLKVINLDM